MVEQMGVEPTTYTMRTYLYMFIMNDLQIHSVIFP